MALEKMIASCRQWLSRIRALARLRPFDTSTADGRSMERQRNILLNTATTFMARGVSLAVNLYVIRLVLARLGKEEYGVWVAISAFVMWTTLLDFGILNSLVNTVSEAFGKDDRETILRHVSTAFFSLIVVAVLLAAGAAVLAGNLNWSALFSSAGVVSEGKLRWSVLAALAPFIAGIPLSVVRHAYTGLQRAYVSNAFLVLSALLTLAAVWIALACGGGLPWLVLASGAGAPLGALLNLCYMGGLDLPWLKPRLDRLCRASLRRLLRSSIPLFLFQLGALLVNYSQPFLLAHAADYSLVADYSLLLRLYTLAGTVMVLSTSSFFPAFREAFEKGDRPWVRRNFSRLLGVRMALAGIFALLLAAAGNAVLRAWLGKDAVSFAVPVWLALAAVFLVTSWGTAFSDLLTVMDRIWIQVAVVLLNGAATVLLTLWLTPRLGLMGALVANGFVPLLIWSWLGPLRSRPILARRVDPSPAG